MEKLGRATAGRFGLTTDGWAPYPDAIGYHLGDRTDYAVLIKEYATDPEGQRRYSPPRIIASHKTPVHGYPVTEDICTSHVERHNLDHADELPAVRALDERFFEEVGQSPGGGGAPHGDLQPVPDALLDSDDPGDEGGGG